MNHHALIAAALLLTPLGIGAQTISLWPGLAPGSERWTQKEVTYENTPVGTVIQNVVTPTITAFLPERSKATGAGIIIAPGGGFIALATTNGGTDVAHWLQARGVAAFVLKYRTIEQRGHGIPAMDQDTAARYGIADAMQAMRVVRQHAAEWHVQPHKLGIIGFSAGGMVASGALLQGDSIARPNFAALIYGAPFGVLPRIPGKLPPVFMAWAKDDGIAKAFMPRFAAALRAAGSNLSEHIYATGGHGFGIAPRGAPADRWSTDFEAWLRGLGMLPSSPARDAMPADLEMRFALSGLPASMRESASVYRLDVHRGYQLGKRGTSGVACLVQRTAWEQDDYRDDIYVPRCFDAAGARTYMNVLMDAEQLRIQGMDPPALKQEIEARYKSGRYRPPSITGVSYMLAPVMRTWLPDNEVHTMSGPHVMFYAPKVSDKDIGATSSGARTVPFTTEEGVPAQRYIIQLAGSAEKAAIVAGEKALIADLCAYRAALCLTRT